MSVNPSATAASTSTLCRIAVAGASGRMGRMLIEAIRASDDCVLAGALDQASSPAVGSDACAFLGYASGVAITADLRQACKTPTCSSTSPAPKAPWPT